MLRCHHLIMVVLCLLLSLQAATPDIKNKQTLSAYFHNVRADWALYVFAKSGPEIEENSPISYVFWGLGPKDTSYEKIQGIAKKYTHPGYSPQKNILRIQPSTSLNPDKIWMLRLESPDNNENNLHYTLENWYPQLITPFTVHAQITIHSKSRDLNINWSIPVSSKEKKRIFRDYIDFVSHGIRAQNSPNGTSKTIHINGKTLTFKLDTRKSIDSIATEKDKGYSDDSMKILIQGEPMFEGHLTLKAGIPAEDGQTLKTDQLIPIRIGVNNPHLWYLGADYLPLHGATDYPFFTNYLSNAKINLKKIKNQEAPLFFLLWKEASQKQQESWKSIKQALPHARPSELNEWRTFMQRPLNTKDVKSETNYNYEWTPSSYKELKHISIADISQHKTITPGLYFMDILGTPDELTSSEIKHNGYPENDMNIFPLEGVATVGAQKIIQITDIGCLWKQSSKRIFFYFYSLKTGEPLRNTVIRFLDSEGKTITECKAKDGTATLNDPQNATLLMFINGEDQCILRFPDDLTSNAPRYIESIDSPTPFPIKRKISFISNRDTLQEGGIFHLKAIMRGNDGEKLQLMPTEKCYLTIQNSAGKVLKSEEVSWDKHGTLNIDFQVPSKISVSTKWNDNALPEFTLQHNTGPYTLSLYFPRNGTAHKVEEDSPATQNANPFATDLEYYERSQRHFETTFTPQTPSLVKESAPVTSSQNAAQLLKQNTETILDISPDKKLYTTGENATIYFAQPISGTVLLSVERDHILTQKILNLAPQTQSIEIPILKDYFPNAFISIAQIQLDQNPQRLQLDTSEIRVNKLENQLAIELKNPIINKQGAETNLQGSVHDHLGKPMPDTQILIQVEAIHADTQPNTENRHTIEQDFYPSQLHRIRTGSTLHLLESRLKAFHRQEQNEEIADYIPNENEIATDKKTSTSEPGQIPSSHADNLWNKDIYTNADGYFSTSWRIQPNQRYLIHITAISSGEKIGSISKEYTTAPNIQTKPSTNNNTDSIKKP